MKRIIVGVFITGCLLIAAPAAHACFCIVPDVREALEGAKAVFLGEVIDITEPRTTDVNAPLPDRLFKIKFKIKKAWKGVPVGVTEISILSAQRGDDCFAYPPVRKGEFHLVYANPAWGAPRWGVITGCTRTAIVSPGTVNLKFLGSDEGDPFEDMKQLDVLTSGIFSRNKSPKAKRGYKVAR
jgi:hypothetical protein